MNDLRTIDDHSFQGNLDKLVQEAEKMRMSYMNTYRGRHFISLTVTLLTVLIGSSGFGWFFLVDPHIGLALFSLIFAISPSILILSWTDQPIRQYKNEYKSHFMPKLAKALGNLSYSPKKGISQKLISKSGIIPMHSIYETEDCFYGRHKGVKVILSETRLHAQKKGDFVFDGLFVLLEMKDDVFKGHTILTADAKLAKRVSAKLNIINIDNSDFSSDFSTLSSNNKFAKNMVNEEFTRHIHQMFLLFDRAPLSAVIFGKKYLFFMIPHNIDMFEASDMYIPIRSNSNTMKCKKEIEQILSIIEVLDGSNFGKDNE